MEERLTPNEQMQVRFLLGIPEIFMKEIDKIVLTASGVAIIDGIVATLDPSFLTAWWLCLALWQANIRYREKRALEWVENIRDNPLIFTAELLDDENFQDGFVYLFQKYILERNKDKRKIVKNILLGFAKSDNRGEFELEKICNTLDRLSIEDIEILRIWIDGSIEEWDKSQGVFPEGYVSPSLNSLQIGKFILDDMKWMKAFSEIQYAYEKLRYLVSTGLLTQEIPKSTYFTDDNFTISIFGKNFVQFIKNF